MVLATFKFCKFQPRLLSLFKGSVAGLVILAAISCEKKIETGTLFVKSQSNGAFEIYRVIEESPLQLTAEQLGRFNQPTTLTPGSYLVLSDCSSKTIIIHPKKTTSLAVNSVEFIPPSDIDPGDAFVIQCTRYDDSQGRQRLLNTFKLNMFDGKWDLLVGMLPIKINFDQQDSLQSKSFHLSALKVKKGDQQLGSNRYFVSPRGQLLSITESQELGKRLFILPGEYVVQLNGSKTEVPLDEGEEFFIQPGFLNVSSSDKVDLSLSSTIKGDPLYVDINHGHWLDLNETYPLLPGTVNLRLVGTDKSRSVAITAGDLVSLETNSIHVKLDCPTWEWSCLGSKKIFLYQKEAQYPFASGTTDVPLLFFDTEAYLSIEGSNDIRYKLAVDKRDHVLHSGIIHLIPQFEVKNGLKTDLARVESIGLPMIGNTFDIPLERRSKMTLVTGTYNLSIYHSITSTEGERRKNTRRLYVSKNKQRQIRFPVYVSEKSHKKIVANIEKQKKITANWRRNRYSKNYRPARTFIIE